MVGKGFALGIAKMVRDVERAASALSFAATAPVAAPVVAPAGRPVTVHQTYYVTLKLDELRELVEAAEFVRELPTARELAFLG
jgi:uncharacterized protein YbjT (DUF2867 family)